MPKRKLESSLDDFFGEYFKKAKCERTLKLFENKTGRLKNENVCERFMNYLKRKEAEKENEDDELGFEINFGAYETETKVSFTAFTYSSQHIDHPGKYFYATVQLPTTSARKPLREKRKDSNVKKVDIPKDFIKKIKKLGMNVDEAETFYKTKIDWTAVYSDNKIYCPEKTCDYSTNIDDETLRDHLINVHNYGEYPCQYPECNFTGVSKVRILEP